MLLHNVSHLLLKLSWVCIKLFLSLPQGDSVIRYYELVPEAPYCYYLSTFQSSDPQKGCGFMPKRGCNVSHNEVVRVFKVHSTKPICEPISFTVPRKVCRATRLHFKDNFLFLVTMKLATQHFISLLLLTCIPIKFYKKIT